MGYRPFKASIFEARFGSIQQVAAGAGTVKDNSSVKVVAVPATAFTEPRSGSGIGGAGLLAGRVENGAPGGHGNDFKRGPPPVEERCFCITMTISIAVDDR